MIKMVQALPGNQCLSDPLPTWLLKENIDAFLTHLHVMVSTTWRCTVSYEVCLYYAEAEEDGRYQQKPSDVTF